MEEKNRDGANKAALVFVKDVEGKVPHIAADEDFFDFEEEWKMDASDYSELDLCERKYRGDCGHTYMQCSVCDFWWCIEDLGKVIKFKFNKHNKLINGNLEQYLLKCNESNDSLYWIAPCCTDNIIYANMEPWIDIMKDFINEQYGNKSGRLKYKDILQSSDYAWKIIDIYRIRAVYKALDYKKDVFEKYLQDYAWLTENKEDFLTWVESIRAKVTGTAFESFLPAENTILVFEVIELKKFIMRFFMDHTQTLLNKYQRFEAELWRETKVFVKNFLFSLQNLFEYEQNAAYNEAILEGLCSGAKHVYKNGMTTKSFLQALTNYLLLNENLAQRELVVNGVVDYHILKYDYGGDIESKYYKAKGDDGQTIDKYKSLSTDGAWSLKSANVPLQTLLNM